MDKVCFKCKERKPLNEFYAQKQMKDGFLNKCKECTKRDVRKNRQESENARAYDRRRYKENPKRREETHRRAREYRVLYPDRYKAHSKLGNAVRDGRIQKPKTCTRCGGKERRIEAHHPDYSKPLDVMWLCSVCHRIVENMTKPF